MALKTKRFVKSDFDEFSECYKAEDRSKRYETEKDECWKSVTYNELIARDCVASKHVTPIDLIH